ncbi:MAG TPA: hypothetical protein VJS12_14295 [Steroidobacteraceae bacterium]|nr:hypothetical protein [Steroidobacteraceae bacterium]
MRCIRTGGAFLAAALAAGASLIVPRTQAVAPGLNAPRNAGFSASEQPNSYEDMTEYNNFYEFGTDKSAPSRRGQALRTVPWTVTIAGAAEVTCGCRSRPARKQ